MGVVFLVRHGQASFGAQDYDNLSERGHHQSHLVGEELRRREVRFAHVLSGDMRRQRDTARAAGFSTEEDPRWNEYDHRSLLAAHTSVNGGEITDVAAMQKALDSALRSWVGAAESELYTENWNDFATRVNAAFDDVIARMNKGENALVFTSGGVIGALAARFIGGQAAGFFGLQRVTCNTGITKVVTGRSGTSLVSFNEHGHLECGVPDLLTYR